MGERRRVGRLIAAFFFILVVQSAPLPASASPWGRADGELYLLTRADYFRARGDFLSSTHGDPSDLFQRLESNSFVEYGLTDKLMIGGKAIYGSSWVSNDLESITASGFSEVEGFIQHRLFRGRRGVGAVRLAGGAPNSFDTGMRQTLVSDGPTAEIRLLYGRTIRDRRGRLYAGIEAGYKHRFGDAADQAIVDAAIGYEPAAKFLLLVQSFNVLSIRNENNGGSDYDIHRVQPSIVWRGGKKWAIEAGVIHEYAGRNFARGSTIFLGLWTTF